MHLPRLMPSAPLVVVGMASYAVPSSHDDTQSASLISPRSRAPRSEKTWEVHVTCVAMVDEDEDHAGSYLTLTVLDKDSDAKSAEISLDNVKWENKPKEGITGLAKGWSRKGQITVPAALGTPGAVLITKKLSPKAKEAEKDFITSFTFKRCDRIRSAMQ
jgi:hypothetical protein